MATVQPARLPRVRYRGRVCVRIGPRRDYATEQGERRLTEKRVSQARAFDAEPCLGAALSDLSKGVFLNEHLGRAVAPEVIEENHRPLEQRLASLRFFDLAPNVPSQAGVLLFGMDVRRFLPGAHVQFLRVAETSLADDILADRELDGDLLSVLRELDALVDAQLVVSPVPESLLRERTVEARPRVAVRELLRNAVLHRDYRSTAPLRISWFDDRIEIQSPGGLYGEATPQSFPRQTSYRNPVVAEALKTPGYVNRFGRGVLDPPAQSRAGAPHGRQSRGLDRARSVEWLHERRDVPADPLRGRRVLAVVHRLRRRVSDLLAQSPQCFEFVVGLQPLCESIERGEHERFELVELDVGDQAAVAGQSVRDGDLREVRPFVGIQCGPDRRQAREVVRESVEIEHRRDPDIRIFAVGNRLAKVGRPVPPPPAALALLRGSRVLRGGGDDRASVDVESAQVGCEAVAGEGLLG